jgi:hypothetical protein
MNTSTLLAPTFKFLKGHAPEILSGLAVLGLGTTAYLAARSGMQMAKDIANDPEEGARLETRQELYLRRAKTHWRTYMPPLGAGVLTTAAIVGSNRVSGQRTAAAVAAYSLSEKAFSRYKEKVVETVGEKKAAAVQDAIAQEQVAAGPAAGLVLIGDGNVLCCELHTGRYFMSDKQALVNAVNQLNAKMVNSLGSEATLNDFYQEIGLDQTSNSHQMGWTSDRLLRLNFSSCLTPDMKAALAFEYEYIKFL